MHIYTHIHSFNADLETPVGLYLNLRDRYRKPILLESNDYHSRIDSTSFIGLNPLVEITVEDTFIRIQAAESIQEISILDHTNITDQLATILASIKFESPELANNGFFSYFSFEYAHFEESIELMTSTLGLPKAHLILYEYLIVLDHFHDNGSIIVNSLNPEVPSIETLEQFLRKKTTNCLPFMKDGMPESTLSDDDFRKNVTIAQQHINRGDVFQLVLSRPFSQRFFGDDFQVYRQLRRLNPSPYLFYADMESYRLMGSSPEAQIQLKNGKASIHPIAGTVRKTGNDATDTVLTHQLIHDEKENAEHTMLVDLARNDLSKYCDEVKISSYKEVQRFSHVIHLVSKVTGQLQETSSLALFSGTFPAGTLSGTPKPKALELIQRYEGNTRDYYGGAIGFISTNGDLNLAIVIRSILSKNDQLHYRAGAGIVLDSIPENELQEVYNKLGAVQKAISAAHSPITVKL